MNNNPSWIEDHDISWPTQKDITIATLTAERDAAVRECGELREVLRVYADIGNWNFISGGGYSTNFIKAGNSFGIGHGWELAKKSLLSRPSAVDDEKVGGG